MDVKQQEFERHLKVAWSCLKDVEKKIDEIREAKDVRDRASKDGTFRGTIAMASLQGRLQRDFEEGLDLAWNSATRASELRPDGLIEVDGLEIAPRTVFAGVCGYRGDLKF